MLTVTNVVSRDQQLRCGRVLRVRVASFGQTTRTMAKELKESKFMERSTCAGGPLDVELQCFWRTLNVWLNVEIWPYPAYGSWIHTPAARPVGLKLNGGREHIWCAMPSVPYL